MGPTWKSFGLHKVCSCDLKTCKCPKQQKVSTIDNAFLSLFESGTNRVLKNSFSYHCPILVTLSMKSKGTSNNLKTIWRRDLTRLKTSCLEETLHGKNLSTLYDLNDPNEAVSVLLEKLTEALDEVAPLKAMKVHQDKTDLSLKRDTLAMMSKRDSTRKNGDLRQYKHLRNKTKSVVKRDKIQRVISCIKRKHGPQSSWSEAMTLLGRKRTAKLPECTSNSNPNTTAEHQNQCFVKKINDLLSKISHAEEKT